MDTLLEKQKMYEILSGTDDMCYAGKWKEIIELGNSLVNDPEATSGMLLIWICNGKFTAFHGNLLEECSKVYAGIEARLEKEVGTERTEKLIGGWKKELADFIAKKSLENQNPPG